MRPAIAAAAIASGIAGVIHLAAARGHAGDRTLLWMFILCGIVQMLWAVVVAARPTRRVLVAGLVINGGALLTWALTRTVGVPMVDALAEVEEVGGQDLGAATFAALSVAAGVVALVRPARARVLTLPWVAALASFAMLSALPAMAAEHAHSDGHEHADHSAAGEEQDHAHGDAEVASATHEHDDGDTSGHEHDPATATDDHHGGGGGAHEDHSSDESGTGHAHADESGTGHAHADEHPLASPAHAHSGPGAPSGHEHPAPTDPGDPDPHQHPTPTDPGDPDPHQHPDPEDPLGPIISLDDPRLTEEQWTAAVQLIIATTNAMQGFVTEEDILAAGYVSIGDGGAPGTYEHFVNWSYLGDAYELDPTRIESIVMKGNADGTKRVVSGMYILTIGKTVDDTPDIAGELTTWHDHDNLCFEGTQLVGLAVEGVCSQGVLINTPPMLHVWIEANPCGPFAAIDEHGEVCDATHEH